MLLLLYLTLTFEAVVGVTVGWKCAFLPTFQLMVCAFSVTLVTGLTTVTIHLALLPLPSVVVAVIIQLPFDFAVITPSELTAATDVSLLLNVSFVFDAVFGTAFAASFLVLFSFSLTALSILTAVTVCFTVTL